MLDSLQQFHFLRPLWLLMLVPLAAAIWLLIIRQPGVRVWERVCDPQLLPHVLIQTGERRRRFRELLFVVIGLLTIVALAGPTWERLPQPVFRSTSALVIALDLSRSMDATDVTPSRLQRARFKVIDILNQRGEGETALIVYAGDAFTVTPLTTDTDTIRSLLPALGTGLMPLQGHRADRAMEMAAELMQQAGHARGRIILVTDEVDAERESTKAEELLARGYRTSVLGVGTGAGAPVTLPNGGFLKDKAGQIVIPSLDPDALRRVASSGGGIYRTLDSTPRDIQALTNWLSTMPELDKMSETQFQSDQWLERGPWLVLLLIPLVALSFRRGVILAVAVVILPVAEPVRALDREALWLNDNQRAQRLLEAGKAEQAAKLFTDPRWRAAAEYRSGNYEQSLEYLDNIEDPESVYNRGNALAKTGQYEDAIEAYEQVLEAVPEHEDARHNLELVKKALEKLKPPPQQDPGGGGEKEPADDADARADESESGEEPAEDKQSTQAPDSNQDADSMAQENAGDQEVSGNSEQQQEGEEDRLQQAGRPGESENQAPPEQSDEEMIAGNESTDEDARATEQWLRRIPDDPGGLLRRKFMMQYKERGLSRHNYEQDW